MPAMWSRACTKTGDDVLRRAVGKVEPDCILLDGMPGSEYGSWDAAAWLDDRSRSIPTVMFTAHHRDVLEATQAATERSRNARFSAIIEKPFQIDDLLDAVGTAVGQSVRFDRGQVAETARTGALVAELKQRGATAIEPSHRREWATFRDPAGTLWQIYWWQNRGVYQVGRYLPDGTMKMEFARVVVNPLTGQIVSTNPLSGEGVSGGPQ